MVKKGILFLCMTALIFGGCSGALKENENAVLTFPFSFDRTCSDLQKRGGKMNADAWKRGKSL